MKKLVILIAFILVLTACDLGGILPPLDEMNYQEEEAEEPAGPAIEPVEPAAQPEPAAPIYRFMDGLLASSGEDNACISPLAFKLALAIAYNGAEGESAELLKTMFDDATPTEINDWALAFLEQAKEYKGARGDAETPPSPELLIANSYWLNSKYARDISSEFTDVISASYGAKRGTFVRIPDEINEWVSAATKGRIEDILAGIDTYAMLYFVNALYFRGNWESEFDKDDNEPLEFMNPDGKAVEVTMFRGRAEGYIDTPAYEGVTKNLHGGMTFTAVMSKSGEGVGLNGLVSAREAADESYSKVDLAIPRFSFNTEVSIMEGDQPEFDILFSHQGLSGALSENAKVDYFFISGMFQKTTFTFAEKGIDSTTAASYVPPGEEGVQEGDREEVAIIFDRPFYFTLTDKDGEILLYGKVTALR